MKEILVYKSRPQKGEKQTKRLMKIKLRESPLLPWGNINRPKKGKFQPAATDRYKSIICEEETYLMELIRILRQSALLGGKRRSIGG